LFSSIEFSIEHIRHMYNFTALFLLLSLYLCISLHILLGAQMCLSNNSKSFLQDACQKVLFHFLEHSSKLGMDIFLPEISGV
jgi:hypothetical protein